MVHVVKLSSVSSIKVCSYFVGEEDLYNVLSAVADLARRWYDLGISLKLRPSDLDAIPPNTDSSNALTQMLLLWLRQTYNARNLLLPLPVCLVFKISPLNRVC